MNRRPGSVTRPEALRRLRRTALARLHGAAIDAGLLPYRPIERIDAQGWGSQYDAGDWDHLACLNELGRYSLIAGYVRHLGPARSILDLGCGTGLLVRSLGASDFDRYVGVDPATSVIARARQLEGRDGVQFIAGELPPPVSGRFHFIVANEVLYYLKSPESVLERVIKLLEPDGYLLTSIWRHRGDAALHKLIERRFDPLVSVELLASGPPRTTRTRVTCWRPASITSS